MLNPTENRTTTTKIFREDLLALRKLKSEHRLHGIADTISWLLDRAEATAPLSVRRLCVEIAENEQGELTATVFDVY